MASAVDFEMGDVDEAQVVESSGSRKRKSDDIFSNSLMIKKQRVDEYHNSSSSEDSQIFRIIENDQSVSHLPLDVQLPSQSLSQSHSQSPVAFSPPTYELPGGIENIDEEEFGPSKAAAEYSPGVDKYMRHVEMILSPSSDYLSRHAETNEKMRAILLDWMAEVHLDFKMWSSSMFLAISILDRYLEANPDISRLKLQLAGIGAMFVASKFEQTTFQTVNSFVEISDCCYTAAEVLEMELLILKDLNWNVRVPTALDFLNRLVKAARFEDSLQLLSRYILELVVVEYEILRFKPSLIAASTIFVSRKIMSRKPTWNKMLEYYSGYSSEDLELCVFLISQKLRKESYAYSISDGQNGLRAATLKYLGYPAVPLALSYYQDQGEEIV